MSKMFSPRIVSLAVALGVVGGAVIVLSHMFFTPGKYVLITYAVVIVGATLAVRAERLASFAERFATGLLAFALYAGAHYVAVSFSPGVSSLGLLGHAWRLALLLGIGAVINLATARLASPPMSRVELHAT
ncbi:MAG TPA: hypothetical protein VII32_11290 [Thermoanaerobaculia bacterium]